MDVKSSGLSDLSEFESYHNQEVQVQKTPEKRLKCLKCDQSYSGKGYDKLKNHYLVVHQCHFCGRCKTFHESLFDLCLHRRESHPTHKFWCGICKWHETPEKIILCLGDQAVRPKKFFPYLLIIY